MDIADVTRGERGFTITWSDDSVAEFPFIWLRDNDPDDLHPDTRERVFDLASVSIDLAPDSFVASDAALRVRWPDKDAESTYGGGWLHRHQPGSRRADPASTEQTLWDAGMLSSIPRCNVSACTADSHALKDALLTLKRFGLLIFDGLADEPDASYEITNRIGFRRQTNFGEMFEVVSKPDPNNLAYTSMALPLHTDLPNQELIPGYQFLHAYRNTANGGDSVFADGFRICSDLKTEAPDDFDLLTRVPVPFRFHDDDNDIRRSRPLIAQHRDGTFDYLVFNAHIADLPDMDTETIYAFYRAYHALMQRIRDPKYAISYRMLPGEMVAFDNSRVLHGRTAFDPDSGERHYRGYYIERNEVDSRIRVLSRN